MRSLFESSQKLRRGAVSLKAFVGAAAEWLFVAAFLLGVLSATAQSSDFFSHQAWSTEEGLPQASVHSIFQSQDGYLWVATEGGVARFDGYGFTELGHDTSPAFTSNDITSIAEAPKGVLWFGTSDGLVRTQGTSVRRFSVGDGLPSAVVLMIAAASDGSLLILTETGLVRFDGIRL